MIFSIPATDFAALDAFMRGTSGLREVAVKRTPCSRAFEIECDFVEFYLVRSDDSGLFTDFWGYVHRWPADTLSDETEFGVASVASLESSRRVWSLIEQAFDTHAARQRCPAPVLTNHADAASRFYRSS